MPNDDYFRDTHPASFRTDLTAGILSPKDRDDWLRHYGFPPHTCDDVILFAIGTGHA